MVRLFALTCCLLLLLATTGCSPKAPEPPRAEASAAPAATPSGDELNQAIQQPIDRAKAVEADLMKAQQDDDEALKEQGG